MSKEIYKMLSAKPQNHFGISMLVCGCCLFPPYSIKPATADTPATEGVPAVAGTAMQVALMSDMRKMSNCREHKVEKKFTKVQQ